MHNMVLYPSTARPINVMDFIYKRMIQDSIQRDIPIAMAFLEDPYVKERVVFGQRIGSVREVAGIGKPHIVEERPDGSLLVLVQGQGKVHLKEAIKTNEPYIVCEADIIEENHVLKPELIPIYEQVKNILNGWVQKNILDSHKQQVFSNSIQGPEEVVGVFASFLMSDYDMQHLILESNDINEKVELVYRLVQSQGLVY